MSGFPITSKFQATEDFRNSPHLGVDFAFPKDTELRSIMGGVVERVLMIDNNSLGKAVYIRWKDGKTAIYGHLSETFVKKGDVVGRGDLIGLSGNTGNVFGKNGGYHLHFGLKDENGILIDPEPYAPLIQNMGDLESVPLDQGIDQLEFTENMFQSTMDKFGDFLSDVDMGEISQLFDTHTILPILRTIFLWIF